MHFGTFQGTSSTVTSHFSVNEVHSRRYAGKTKPMSSGKHQWTIGVPKAQTVGILHAKPETCSIGYNKWWDLELFQTWRLPIKRIRQATRAASMVTLTLGLLPDRQLGQRKLIYPFLWMKGLPCCITWPSQSVTII